MGFKIPVGIKEPFEKLPTGYIMFNIDKVSEGDLGKEGDPVYGFLADLTAEEPSEVTGITKEERFYLGIRPTDKRVQNGRAEADPMCEKEETLKATLGRFKAFAAAAGVDIEGKDSDAVFSELQNRKVVAKVSHTVGRDNPEQTFAQVDRWLPAGTIEPHVTEEAAKHQGGKAPATAGPAPARAAAPAPAPKAAAPAGRPTPQRLGARTATA
jgi:hypothetical protein